MVTFLVGASSEAEDSSSDSSSSEDSSLDSSLELDGAAAVIFVGAAFTGGAFGGAGFDWVDFVAAPFAAALGGGASRAPFADAALVVGLDGFSSESSLSESSSLSLSLTGFAGALIVDIVAGLSSDSLSFDSEELPLGGGALDCRGMNLYYATKVP